MIWQIWVSDPINRETDTLVRWSRTSFFGGSPASRPRFVRDRTNGRHFEPLLRPNESLASLSKLILDKWSVVARTASASWVGYFAMAPAPYPCALHNFFECGCAVLYGLDLVFFRDLSAIAQGPGRILFFEGHPGLHVVFLQCSSFRRCKIDDVTLGVLAYRIF